MPVERQRARGSLLDVVNRGNTVAVPNFNRATRPVFGPGVDPNPPIDAGDGFLMRRGWMVASCGWQADVPELAGLFGSTLPRRAAPTAVRLPDASTRSSRRPETSLYFLLSDRNHLAYPAADLGEAALLVVRDQPDGPVTTIPASGGGSRGSWPGNRWLILDTLRSTEGSRRAGCIRSCTRRWGLPCSASASRALRDCVAWLASARRPRTIRPGRLTRAYAYGRLQMGRFLRTLVYHDLNVDETGRGPRRHHRQRGGRHAGRVQPAVRTELEGQATHDGAPVPIRRRRRRRTSTAGGGTRYAGVSTRAGARSRCSSRTRPPSTIGSTRR